MESMKGFVTFEDKKYPFSFSGERLALYPDEFSSQSLQEFFAPFERGNTIKDIELNGITANRKKVVFEVSEQYSDEEGFLSFIQSMNMIHCITSSTQKMVNKSII